MRGRPSQRTHILRNSNTPERCNQCAWVRGNQCAWVRASRHLSIDALLCRRVRESVLIPPHNILPRGLQLPAAQAKKGSCRNSVWRARSPLPGSTGANPLGICPWIRLRGSHLCSLARSTHTGWKHGVQWAPLSGSARGLTLQETRGRPGCTPPGACDDCPDSRAVTAVQSSWQVLTNFEKLHQRINGRPFLR